MDWKLIPDSYRGERLSNLRVQASVRLLLCILTGLYYALTAHLTDGLYLLFILYTLTLQAVVKHVTDVAADGVIAVTMCADHCFALAGLVVLGEEGHFLIFLLAQMGLGYGIRFGKNVLACSGTLTVLGMFWVTHLSAYWQGNAHVTWTVATAIPVLFTYLYFLIDALSRSERRAAVAETGLVHTVRFVSHDMRTQLQALRAALRDIPLAQDHAAVRRHVTAADDIVTSLTRLSDVMLTRIASTPESSGRDTPPGHLESAGACADMTVGAFVGAIAARFSALFASNALVLEISPAALPLRPCATDLGRWERLLINVMANAARHAPPGAVRISWSATPGDQHGTFVRLTFSNPMRSSMGRDETMTADDASGLGLAICQELAEEIGGQFATSRGPGPTFTAWADLRVCAVCASIRVPRLDEPVACFDDDFGSARHARNQLSQFANVVLFPSTENDQVKLAPGAVSRLVMMPRADLASLLPISAAAELPRYVITVRNAGQVTAITALPNFTEPTAAGFETVAFLAAYTIDRPAPFVDVPVLPTPLPLAGRRLLVVDDIAFNREFLAKVVERAGGRCVRTGACVEAAALLKEQSFDALLCDWHLGDATAQDLFDMASAHLPGIVVVITGDRAAVTNPNRPDYPSIKIVSKPLDESRLIDMLCEKHGEHTASSGAHSRSLVPDGPASDWLQISLYEDLLAEGGDAKHLEALLRLFTEELTRLLEHLSQDPDNEPHADFTAWESPLHAIKGLAETAGARHLAAVVSTQSEATDASGNNASHQKLVLLSTAAITLRHVEMLRASLRKGEPLLRHGARLSRP